jgi:lipoprotein NlpI
MDTATQPKNPDAYNLYLGSLTVSHDSVHNKAAITALERVVEMDPTYAPAWEALGRRHYYDSRYGGEKAFQRSNAAYALRWPSQRRPGPIWKESPHKLSGK